MVVLILEHALEVNTMRHTELIKEHALLNMMDILEATQSKPENLIIPNNVRHEILKKFCLSDKDTLLKVKPFLTEELEPPEMKLLEKMKQIHEVRLSVLQETSGISTLPATYIAKAINRTNPALLNKHAHIVKPNSLN